MLDYRIHFAKMIADDRLRAATARTAGDVNPSRIHRLSQSPTTQRSRVAR